MLYNFLRPANIQYSHSKNKSIPVWCVPPTCANHACFNSHQMSAPGGLEVDKFDQVSSDGHKISLAEGLPCVGGQGCGVHVHWGPSARGACKVWSNVSWVMVTRDPPPWTDWLTDGQTWPEIFPSRNFVGVVNYNSTIAPGVRYPKSCHERFEWHHNTLWGNVHLILLSFPWHFMFKMHC